MLTYSVVLPLCVFCYALAGHPVTSQCYNLTVRLGCSWQTVGTSNVMRYNLLFTELSERVLCEINDISRKIAAEEIVV